MFNFFVNDWLKFCSVYENANSRCWHAWWIFPKLTVIFENMIFQKEILILWFDIFFYQTNCAFIVLTFRAFKMVYNVIVMIMMSVALRANEGIALTDSFMLLILLSALRFVNNLLLSMRFLLFNHFLKLLRPFFIIFPNAANFRNGSKSRSLKFVNVMIDVIGTNHEVWVRWIDSQLNFTSNWVVQFCVD